MSFCSEIEVDSDDMDPPLSPVFPSQSNEKKKPNETIEISSAGEMKSHMHPEEMKTKEKLSKLNTDHPKLNGFKTAKGSQLKISSESLKKAKLIFDQEMGLEPDQNNTIKKRRLSGDSENAQKSKKVCLSNSEDPFNDDFEIGTQDFAKTEKLAFAKDALMRKNVESSQNGPICEGFATANGLKLQISDESIKKAEKILSEDNISESKDSKDAKFDGFSTAMGSKFNLSSESLRKAENVFKDEFCDKSAEEFVVPRPKNSLSVKSDGFSSAKGRKFDTSGESLKKAQNIFNEDFDPKIAESFIQRNEELLMLQDLPIAKFDGFSTARGTKFDVSEESLKKAKNIFNDEFHLKCAKENKNFSEDDSSELKDLANTKFSGFSTAKGTRFNISADSLKKAKNIFSEEFDPMNKENPSGDNFSQLKTLTKSKFDGFSTAKGTKFNVSETSLKKAKNIFREEFNPMNKENPSENNLSQLKNLTNSKFDGFSTAKGTKFNISEDSLKKAKNTFSEDFHHENEENISKLKNFENEKFAGFSTAKGTKFDISEDSLKLARKIFNEEYQTQSAEINPEEQKKFPTDNFSDLKKLPDGKFDGFSTAKGSKFNISEESLKKAKNIFSEEHPTKKNEKFSESRKFLTTDSSSEMTKMPNVIFDGLSTAKDTNFKVSEESLKNTKKIIGEEFHSENTEKMIKGNIGEDIKSSQESTDMKILSNCKDVFEDDFIVDTQILQDVERMAMNSQPKNDQKPRCKIVGIPMVHQSILEKRKKMRQEQEANLKTKTDIFTAHEGSLSKSKKSASNRIKLKNLEKINTEEQFATDCNITETALNMNSSYARDHVFVGRHYFSEEILTQSVYIELGDKVQVVLNDACNIDLEAIILAFQNSPGVNKSKVKEDWIQNHYRWIVWKLASLERRFPNKCAGLLHPNMVLLQLRYRYDKEIEGQSRSALRKIYEKDDVPSKCLVLVIAEMKKLENESGIFLELSDGWYSIGCKVDESFSCLVVGTKLITFGAELVNHDQPCSPLEAPSPSPDKIKLKIHLNSTRRARWDVKLGYHSYPSLPTNMKKLVSTGGYASELTLYLARKYPIVYQLDTKKYISQRNYDSLKIDQDLEQIYQEVQQEFEKREHLAQKAKRKKPHTRRSITNKEINNLVNGSEINEALENSPDPGMIEALLSPAQRETVQDYKRRLMEEQYAAMTAEVKSRMRDIKKDKPIPMLKLSVIDVSGTLGTLSMWRPNEDLFHGLKEKSLVKVNNAMVISIRDSIVHLKCTKQTRFKLMDNKITAEFAQNCDRKIESIEDILTENFDPKFSEVDVLGVVINIGNLNNQGFQAIHLCDAMFNFVSVQFWGGIGKHSLDSVIKMGSVLLFSNLQWRKSSANGNFFQSKQEFQPTIPCLYVTEFTLVNGDVKEPERSKMIRDLAVEVKKVPNFLSEAKIRYSQLTTKRPTKPTTPAFMTPPTPMPKPIPTPSINSNPSYSDPPLAKSPVEIVENSPAYYQSMRNKKRLAVLEQFNNQGLPGSAPTLPTLNTTPLVNRTKDSKLRKTFKVPFIDRLKKAYK